MSLGGNIAGAMTKSRCRYGIQLQSRTGPKDSPEALKHVLSLLLIRYLLPNTAVPPHISPFIIKPLPGSIAVAILILCGRKVNVPWLEKSMHCWASEVYFRGAHLASYQWPCCRTSIMPLKFGRLVLGLKFGIKLLRMPHIHLFIPNQQSM